MDQEKYSTADRAPVFPVGNVVLREDLARFDVGSQPGFNTADNVWFYILDGCLEDCDFVFDTLAVYRQDAEMVAFGGEVVGGATVVVTTFLPPVGCLLFRGVGRVL